MDKLILEEAEAQGTPLDLELIKTAFEQDPKGAADSHVIETLFSITDFLKFKELMVAFKSSKLYVQDISFSGLVRQVDVPLLKAALIEDAKTLHEYNDEDIWDIYSKIDEDKIIYKTKKVQKLNEKLKSFKIETEVFKFIFRIKNIKLDNVVRFLANAALSKKVLMEDVKGMIGKFDVIHTVPNDWQISYMIMNIPILTARDSCILEVLQETSMDGKKAY